MTIQLTMSFKSAYCIDFTLQSYNLDSILLNFFNIEIHYNWSSKYLLQLIDRITIAFYFIYYSNNYLIQNLTIGLKNLEKYRVLNTNNYSI